jgi:hypothetical protein
LLIVCCELPQPSGKMLLCLLKSGEEVSDLLKETPERALLRRINYHLSNSGFRFGFRSALRSLNWLSVFNLWL